MKILSVVTLVSPDGAYGGPLRVAVNQAKALAERGHEVTLIAAHRGYGAHPPVEIEGIPARLFPARRVIPRTGFAGLAAPGMLPHLARHARSFDVAHVHVARDLITLPAARLLGLEHVPYVLQTHGMIDESGHPLTRVLDPALTLPVCRRAARVFYLTSTERVALEAVAGPGLRLERLTNGVPETDLVADPATAEVLYLARLAPRKRPQIMVDIASALSDDFPDHRYRLVGPDEGEAAALAKRVAADPVPVLWEGPLGPDATLERMSRAGVYVLPSVHEPYCMTVLEAMSVGLPVALTEQNGLASVVERTGAGVVAGTSSESLTEAVRAVIGDPEAARRMGGAGRRAARTELGMGPIADALEAAYAQAIRR